MKILISFLGTLIVIAFLICAVGWIFVTDFLIFDILLWLFLIAIKIVAILVVLIITIRILIEIFV